MKRPILLVGLFALLTLVLNTTSPSADFYISTSGANASGDGSLAKPWATLDWARDQVYSKGLYKTTPVTIWILGGNYFIGSKFLIDASHSGSPTAPVAYKAYNNQTVRLIGGVNVNTATAVKTTSPLFKSETVAMIYEINLANQGISSLLGLTPVKLQDDMDHCARSEIFLNGAPCTLARWPNNGFAKVAASGTSLSKFNYSEDEPSLNTGTGGYVFSCFHKWLWFGSTQAISSINPSTKEISFSPNAPNSIVPDDAYYLFNLPRELDSPGEYYMDRTVGKLYLYPPLGTNLATSELLVSTLNAPIVSMTNATNVELSGLQIEAGCNDGIEINSSTNCTVDYCTIKNVAVRGVHINGGSNNYVHHCAISDVGVDGVTVQNSGIAMTITGAGHRIEYNDIMHTGRVSAQVGAAGVNVGTCIGVYVRHNSIHDADTYAIRFGGNNGAADLFFEYNDIYKTCQYIDDAGPIYGGDGYHGNTYFNYNYIHDSGGQKGGGTAIYLDVHSSNGVVFGNVVKNCTKLLSQNGGRNGTAENNIFINDQPTNSCVPIDLHTGTDDATTFCIPSYIKYVLLGGTGQNPAYNRLPYTTGNVYNIQADGVGVPKYNQGQNNVSINAADYYFDANVLAYQRFLGNNIRYDAVGGAGFVDPANGNFALSSTSDIYTKLPGFQPIPFDQIGSGISMPPPTVHEQIVKSAIPAKTGIDFAIGATVTANSGADSAATLTDGNANNGAWITGLGSGAYVQLQFPAPVTISQVELEIDKSLATYVNKIRIEVFDEAAGTFKYWTGQTFASLPPVIEAAGPDTQAQYITDQSHSFLKSTIFQFDRYLTTSKIRVWILDTLYGGHIQGLRRISAYKGDSLGSLVLNKPVTFSGYAARSVFDPDGLTDGTEWSYRAWDASTSPAGPPASQLANFTVPLGEAKYFDRFVVVAGVGKSAYFKNIRIEAKDASGATIWWNGTAWVPLPISDTAPYAQQIQYVTATNSGTSEYLDVQTTRIRSDQVRVWILDSYAEGIQLVEFCLFDSQGISTAISVTGAKGRIALSWPAVAGATSYTVMRSLTSGSGYALAGTAAGNTFADSGLTNGVTYYYLITAMNGNTVISQYGEVAGSPTDQGNGVWLSGVSGNWSVVGNWQANLPASGTDSIATFSQTPGGTVTQNISGLTLGNLQFGAGTYTVQGSGIDLETTSGFATITTGSNVTATVSAPLTGRATLSKTGSGTLILSGSNSYSGGTSVSDNNSALRVSNDLALGSGSTVAVANNARVELAGGVTVSGMTVSIAGNGGDAFVVGALRSVSGTNKWDGPVIIAADGTRIGSMNNASLEISGPISASGNANHSVRYRTAGGQLTISGTNTYSGNSQMNGNTGDMVSVTSIKNTGTPGSLGTSGTILIGSGNTPGYLRYIGSGDTSDRSLDLAASTASVTLDQSGTGLLKFTSDVTASGTGSKTFTLTGTTAGAGELAGAIVDNSASNVTSLQKNGSGLWILSGTNTYIGATTLNSGTLQIGNGTSDGSITSSSAIVNNASLVFNVAGSANYPGSISGSGTLTKDGGGRLTLSGSATVGGGTVVNSGTLTVDTGGVLASGTLTVADGAVCELRNPAGTLLGSPLLTLGASGQMNLGGGTETVVRCTIGGVLQCAGTFSASTHPANLTGTGKLVVTTGATVPTGLTTIALAGGLVALNWTDNPDETGFVVERSTAPGTGFIAIGTVPANTTSFTDTTAEGGIAYYYRINSLESGPTAAYSAEASATTFGRGNGTWTSLVNGNWNTIGNWQGQVIGYGSSATAVFSQTTGVTITQDLPGLMLGNLQFTKGNFTIQSGTLTLAHPSGTSTATVTNGVTATVSSVLAGNVGLSKSGSGTLVLSGSNTYAGATTVNDTASVVRVSNDRGFGNSPSVTAANNTRVELSGGVTVTGKTITISGAGGDVYITGALRGVSGTSKWNGPVIIAANDTRIGSMNSASQEVSGPISATGNASHLIRYRTAGGNVIVSGTNTYSGNSLIYGSAGDVVSVTSIKNAGTPSSLGTSGTIQLGAGTNPACLSYIGSGDVTNRLVELAATTGAIVLDQSGTGLLKFTTNFLVSGSGSKTLTLQGATGAAGEIAGAIADYSATNKTSLTKAGTGAWTLSGSNSYTGPTVISAGTLVLNPTGSIASATLNVASGAVCELRNPAGAIPDTAAIYLNGTAAMKLSGVSERVAQLYLDGALVKTGTWTTTRDPVHFSGTGNLIVTNGVPLTTIESQTSVKTAI